MEATLLKTKEEMIKKERKKSIVLLCRGNIPKDFPKDKLIEYLSLKKSYELGLDCDVEKLRKLEEELLNWPRSLENDPGYINILNLAEELRFILGFHVEFAFEDNCRPSLSEVLASLVSRGFYNILIVPLDYINGISESTIKIIEDFKTKNSLEINIAWPFKLGLQADFIATHVLSFMRKQYQ